MAETKTTYPMPNRPPKKYPQKDLHGRVRSGDLFYRDMRRFQEFYVNVFGWDMIRMPQSAGGAEAGAENPQLITASGPAQFAWEALTAGHIAIIGEWDPDESRKIRAPRIWMEMHSDPDVKTDDTLADIISHGGKVLYDNSGDPEVQDWARKFVLEDPAGNEVRLWKCSPSRTWEEPEAQRDDED